MTSLSKTRFYVLLLNVFITYHFNLNNIFLGKKILVNNDAWSTKFTAMYNLGFEKKTPPFEKKHKKHRRVFICIKDTLYEHHLSQGSNKILNHLKKISIKSLISLKTIKSLFINARRKLSKLAVEIKVFLVNMIFKS